MSAATTSELLPHQLVEPGRVHKRVYTDPEIFELEMERLWRRTWLFVGHDSQVPQPGNYYATTLARQQVVMTRHTDGKVHVLYNRCAHKGAMVVGDGCGKVDKLRCAYHGWTYGTDGTLLHTPQPAGYEGCGFGLGHAESNLRSLARVASYRGFVFASMSADVPELETWLGPMRVAFDNAVERAPDGEIEVMGGCLRYVHDANWKILLENVSDNMHPMVTHQAAYQPARAVKRELPEGTATPQAIAMLEPFGGGYEFFDSIGLTVGGAGHSYSGGKVSLHSSVPPAPGYVAAMERRYGADETRRILSVQLHNTIIYPNMTFKATLPVIRVYRPLAVDRTIQEVWTYRQKGTPDEMYVGATFYNHLIFSPASMAGHDDWEAYHRVQQGLISQASDWISQHRHMGKESANGDGTFSALGTSDVVFRHEFAEWRKKLKVKS